MFNKKLAKIKLIPKKTALALIAVYRYLISPFLGSNCRFEPSCSQYAQIAIQRFGLVYGGWLTLKRLLRCHPFHPGGIDPVPNISEFNNFSGHEKNKPKYFEFRLGDKSRATGMYKNIHEACERRSQQRINSKDEG